MKDRKQPRNVVIADGLPWIKRGGQLWGTYDVCAEYCGIARSSFPVYVWRHGIRVIKHGRRTIAAKDDIDLKTGTTRREPLLRSERLPMRARRRVRR